MKIEQMEKEQFKPIVLTLETQLEVNILYEIGRANDRIPEAIRDEIGYGLTQKLCTDLFESLKVFETTSKNTE